MAIILKSEEKDRLPQLSGGINAQDGGIALFLKKDRSCFLLKRHKLWLYTPW